MSGIYKEDDWFVGETQIDGMQLIIRARSRLPSLPDRQIYENLIIILWPYSANESGMPQHEDNQRSIRFEDAIENALEARGAGVQGACITGNGSKEWRYYAYDTDEFMSKFNQGLDGHPAYPIKLQMFKDPEWGALSELLPKSSNLCTVNRSPVAAIARCLRNTRVAQSKCDIIKARPWLQRGFSVHLTQSKHGNHMATKTEFEIGIDSIFDGLIKAELDDEKRHKYIRAREKFTVEVAARQKELAAESEKSSNDKEATTNRARASTVFKAAPKIANDLKATILAFEKGDAIAGSAGIMNICSTAASVLESLAGASSLAGPLGALASAIFSIIGMVLNMFEQHQKSLADKLEEKLRILQAEDKAQITLTAIDEFDALNKSYPAENSTNRIKVHHYLDALAQGNARDNLLKSGYWLREEKNKSEVEISQQWLGILEFVILAGTKELTNITHLLGLADPNGSEYAQLNAVYRVIAAQHKKMMADIRSAVRNKGWILILENGSETGQGEKGWRPWRRAERGGPREWKSSSWKFTKWSDVSGTVKTIAISEDAENKRRYFIGLEGFAEENKYVAFHKHNDAYVGALDNSSEGTILWNKKAELKACKDVWMHPLPRSEGEGVAVFCILNDKKMGPVYKMSMGEKDEIVLNAYPDFWSMDGEGELLSVRTIPGIPPGSTTEVPYVLIKQGGEYIVQVGHNSGQYLYLPAGFSPRGIAVDEKRLWAYQGTATGEAELICMPHEMALALQEFPNRAACESAWQHYGSSGVKVLNRESASFAGTAVAGAGITHLSGARGNIMTMCFDGHVYSGLVGKAEAGRVEIEWTAYDPTVRAIAAFEAPPKVWQDFMNRMDALEKILAENVLA